MEKILNRLLDLPQVVNSKLPGNTFNSWVQDSESNIPSWVGKFYTVSALVVLLTSLVVILSPLWNGGMGEKMDIVANILSIKNKKILTIIENEITTKVEPFSSSQLGHETFFISNLTSEKNFFILFI